MDRGESESGRDADAPGNGVGRREPWLRFALIFGALAIGSEALFYGVTLDSRGFEAYLRLLARISGGMLDLVGQGVRVNGSTISGPRFAVEVAHGCDAVQITALLSAAILAFPVSMRRKLPGLAFGFVWLQGLNFVRIVSLFLIGAYAPAIFQTSHEVVWPTALVIITIATWIIWVRRALRVEPEPLGHAA